jgi:hypothetical protein
VASNKPRKAYEGPPPGTAQRRLALVIERTWAELAGFSDCAGNSDDAGGWQCWRWRAASWKRELFVGEWLDNSQLLQGVAAMLAART